MTKDEAIGVLKSSGLNGLAFFPIEEINSDEEMEAVFILLYHNIAELRANAEVYVPDLKHYAQQSGAADQLQPHSSASVGG